MIHSEKCSERHFKLFADCIPVRGAVSSAIYDLGRHRIVLFPTAYFDIIKTLDGKSLNFILTLYHANPSAEEKITAVVDYLVKSEVASFVANPALYPALATTFSRSSVIHNAIIDVNAIWHDFPKIFSQLDQLGCEFIQIRVFSPNYSIEQIFNLVDLAANTTIRGVEFLLHHNGECDPGKLTHFVESHPLVTDLVVHSSPAASEWAVDSPEVKAVGLGTGRKVRFSIEKVESVSACGKIRKESINAPTVSVFTETLSRNGCLNKKISIDSNGQIKNCPSFCQSYGSIREIELSSVLKDDHFRMPWNIAKDQIEVCKDCQFRYACTDCRAYVINSSDPFSKPKNCGYDPYLDVWNDAAKTEQLISDEICI